MRKRSIVLISAVTALTCFFAAGIYAGTAVEDVIKLKTPEYKEHSKGIVVFTHKKHAESYGIGCGDCHHDDKGKPLADLKAGDAVQRCVECHSETGPKPKGEKLSKAEKVKKYHKEALHANCISCHKDHNKEKGLQKNDPKAAPTTCNTCHPKS